MPTKHREDAVFGGFQSSSLVGFDTLSDGEHGVDALCTDTRFDRLPRRSREQRLWISITACGENKGRNRKNREMRKREKEKKN